MQEKKSQHILHALPDFDPGGLQRNIIAKISWLKRQGIDSSVASSGGIRVKTLQDNDFHHLEIPLNTGNALKIYSAAGEIRNLIDRTGINLVCAYGPGPAWACHLAALASPIHEPPLIAYAHDLHPKSTFSNSIRRCDRVITFSKNIEEHCLTVLKVNKGIIKTVVPGFDEKLYTPADPAHPAHPAHPDARDRLRREWEIPAGSRLIAGVGRFVESSDWEILLDALNLIPDPKPHLVLVGSSYSAPTKYIASLHDKIEKLGLGGSPGNPPLVRFTRHFENIANVYSAADLIVIPSMSPHPFSHVALESLIFDCPVVLPVGSGAAVPLMPNIKDFLVETGSPDALAAKITHVLSNLDSAVIRTRWLAKSIREEMTMDRQMKAELKVIRKLCPEFDTSLA